MWVLRLILNWHMRQESSQLTNQEQLIVLGLIALQLTFLATLAGLAFGKTMVRIRLLML